MALRAIVGVLTKKEKKEMKLKFNLRNLIVNKVRSSNHAIYDESHYFMQTKANYCIARLAFNFELKLEFLFPHNF